MSRSAVNLVSDPVDSHGFGASSDISKNLDSISKGRGWG
jgi:hypothetical protein